MIRRLLIFLLLCSASITICALSANALPPAQLSWIAEPWTGNEKSFQQIRAQIDKLVAQGRDPDVLRRQSKAFAQRDYYNAQAQFRYGYAALRSALIPGSTTKQRKERLQGVIEALNAPASPRSYEYARLRYLVFVRSWYAAVNSSELSNRTYYNDLGKRLVQRNPKDYYLILQLTQQLLYNTSAEYDRRVLSLKYAQSYYKAHPESPDATWLMGEVHSNLAYEFRSDAYARKALFYYRKYIAMAPNAADSSQIRNAYIPLLEKGAYKRHRAS